MEVQIREYADKDKKALLECIVQLQDFVGSIDPLRRIRTGKDFDANAYVQNAVNQFKQKQEMIYVAEQSGKLVGCITGIISTVADDDLERYSSTDGTIEELFIHPDHRGQGVGEMLMEQMEKYFWSQGCSVVKVNCFVPNTKAHAFYNKLGYEDRHLTLMKSK